MINEIIITNNDFVYNNKSNFRKKGKIVIFLIKEEFIYSSLWYIILLLTSAANILLVVFKDVSLKVYMKLCATLLPLFTIALDVFKNDTVQDSKTSHETMSAL